jgi:class 3 adenylate cyclase
MMLMDERPVTRYATAPDGVSLAYRVIGEGALDLVFPSSLGFPVDLLWDDPGFLHCVKRLGAFSRIVMRDQRGIAASGGDRKDSLVWEVADADLTTVLDDFGCGRVVLVAWGPAGPAAIHYAANRPERVSALILLDSFAHGLRQDDHPWGKPADALERLLQLARDTWGTGKAVELLAPSKSLDEGFRAWYARCERLGGSPEEAVVTLHGSHLLDVRDLLPSLSVPTLVLHRAGDRLIRVGAGRYLAEHIPGAKYVELPGDDHLFFVGDTDALMDEIEEFLTGRRQGAEGDVVTATILFTDIAASTEQSARMGHRKWSALTDQHDAMVRASLERHRGREVKTTGDGFLATFDATTRAVRAALEIVSAARIIGLEVRAGLHTGEVEVRPDDVVGLAVSIAKRICDLAGPGQVLVSDGVKGQIVGSGIAASDRGTHALKGVPDEWRLFTVGN